jgi:two-component system sensor histidine kinase BaeS
VTARWSLAIQATGLALVTQLALYGVTCAWLRAGGDPPLVLLLPVVLCTAFVFAFTRYVHHHRLRALADAFERLADGDLSHRLPPAPDADSLPVGRAYDRMRLELGSLTDRLRKTDLARRQLFADLAHELSTPVATVLALTDALALPDVDASRERREDLVSALATESQRLVRLVGDVRDLAELDDPAVLLEHVEVDVGALVEDVCRSRALADPEGPEIECRAIDVELPIDPERFQQVVVNLVSNAQRHARGGKVEVTLERVRLDASSAGGDTEIALRIDDDGPGVSEELLPRLGERLWRADPSRTRATGGSGLGLAIVRAIVDRHGGRLSFARSPAGGLRAEVRLTRAALADAIRARGAPSEPGDDEGA